MRAILTILVSLVLLGSLPGPAAAQGDGPDTDFTEQNSGGRHVIVASVDLPEDGFVVIHDASLLAGKVFESVIGVSAKLPKGESANVLVYLTRPLAGTNETLVAMPHKDTNDNNVYDFVSSQGAADGPFKGGPDAIPESFFVANAPALAGKGLGDISAVPRAVNVTAYLKTDAQKGSGVSVLVDTVELPAAGYVAIHDATLVSGADSSGINANNVLSSVIGVSDLLPAGHHHNVLVKLGNNCAGCKSDGNLTGTLIPMAHRESGGNASKYDFVASGGSTDGPFVGQPGTPLTAVINVVSVEYSNVATETFPAQATGGHIVLFPEVYVPQGGYATVHDETLLSGNVLGSVIGASPFLAPGLHKNVAVTLDFNGGTGITKSQTLVGMLHRETNGNTNYDFVSSQGAQDGPYTGGPSSLSESQLPASLQGKGLGGVNAVPAEVELSATVRFRPHQPSDGNSVLVEYADFSKPGFIAFHDASLLASPGDNVMSSVVGVSGVLNGLVRNVSVAIPGTNCAGCVKGTLNVSQVLVAMPHQDSDGDGRYTFITSGGSKDGPFVAATAKSNTVSALGLNIVVASGEATVPVKVAGATTPTPVSTTPAASAPTSATPAATPTPAGSADTPGFELVALIGALAIAMIALRRR